ncbi:hypothetical protein AB0H03_12155 [Streptomyces sparsogenes]|uniref:hypothetical protein n=1 Tax=Streptomyces sparsogenes TaxID=67365 RepID=UPI0033D04958
MHYDARARARQERYMRSLVAMAAGQAVTALEVLCRERPDATAADARAFFRGVARSADHLGIGPGDGGVDVSARGADRLLWLGRMELVVKDLPRSAFITRSPKPRTTSAPWTRTAPESWPTTVSTPAAPRPPW